MGRGVQGGGREGRTEEGKEGRLLASMYPTQTFMSPRVDRRGAGARWGLTPGETEPQLLSRPEPSAILLLAWGGLSARQDCRTCLAVLPVPGATQVAPAGHPHTAGSVAALGSTAVLTGGGGGGTPRHLLPLGAPAHHVSPGLQTPGAMWACGMHVTCNVLTRAPNARTETPAVTEAMTADPVLVLFQKRNSPLAREQKKRSQAVRAVPKQGREFGVKDEHSPS